MKKLIMSVAMTIMAIVGIGGVATAYTLPALAAGDSGLDYVEKYRDSTIGSNQQDAMPIISVIINVVIGLIGLVAVIMIIVGGIMYTSSQGNPDKVKQAKDIILYSIVGLVVALLAFAVVNFVLTNVFNR